MLCVGVLVSLYFDYQNKEDKKECKRQAHIEYKQCKDRQKLYKGDECLVMRGYNYDRCDDL